MELPKKLLEQIAFNTRSRIEEHMLGVMDKNTHEEYLSQPLQSNNKQLELAISFWTGYNGIFKNTNSNNIFYFMKSITDEDGFVQITKLPVAYELKSLNNKIKRINIDKGHCIEANYPFTIKPIF